MSKKKISAGLLLLQVIGLLLALFGQNDKVQAAATDPGSPFLQVWERSDYPVALGVATRSWYWGPAPFANLTENYAEAPGGLRRVYYYDKSRMEITLPGSDRNSKYYVSNGLLVKEMISGRLQAGDNRFETTQPAEIPVSGDRAGENPISPTYASFRSLLGASQRSTSPISATLNRAGEVDSDSSFARFYPETAPVYYNPDLGHNIPGTLWKFLNLQGLVSKDHRLVTDKIEDWVFSFGLPITEAYWTRSRIGGVEKDVLVQLFERRVLTYTPSNPAAYQVEMGNVGLHYYSWRYAGEYTKPGAAAATTQPPIRLAIPAVKISSPIEYVGTKSDNSMDVPSNGTNVAWYRYGAAIGDIGNAVIAGHYDYYSTGKAVFWDLGKLRAGDTVEVYSTLGTKFTFRVNFTKVYPNNEFPNDTVFGSSNQRNLNLITCEGIFDPISANYDKRLVVYTTLVE